MIKPKFIVYLFFIFFISCGHHLKDECYLVLNPLINSRSEDILDFTFYLKSNFKQDVDTSDINSYLKNTNRFSNEDRLFMISQLSNRNKNIELEKTKLENKNIELVSDFKPTSKDYYLSYSIPVFSKNNEYAYIREYTYYWGKDVITNYIMKSDSSGWELDLMDTWLFGGKYNK